MDRTPPPPDPTPWTPRRAPVWVLGLGLVACGPGYREGDLDGDCTDGADNDLDGVFDCGDPDCRGGGACRGASTTPTGSASTTRSDSGFALVDSFGPGCLEVGTIHVDLAFGFDAAAGQVVPVQLAGATIRPEFRLAFGPRGWDGDTSQPGAPDRWCYVAWDLTGTGDLNTDPAFWFAARADGGVPGTTTCGQESRPGAGDRVDLCDAGSFEPAGLLGPYAQGGWTIRLGGPPVMPGGDEVFGGVATWDLEPPLSFDLLAWGSPIDAAHDVQLGPTGAPVFLPAADQPEGGTLRSGFYQTVFLTYLAW